MVVSKGDVVKVKNDKKRKKIYKNLDGEILFCLNGDIERQ